MIIVPAEMTGAEAPRKQRFRAERILWSALTENRPDRGLVVSNPSGGISSTPGKGQPVICGN
jgi:hypothetical protein